MHASQYLTSFLERRTVAPPSPCLLCGTEDLKFRGYWTVTKLFKCSPNFVLVLITCKISKAVFVRSFWHNWREGMHVRILVKGGSNAWTLVNRVFIQNFSYNSTFGSSLWIEAKPSLELSETGERKAAPGQAAVAARHHRTCIYLGKCRRKRIRTKVSAFLHRHVPEIYLVFLCSK